MSTVQLNRQSHLNLASSTTSSSIDSFSIPRLMEISTDPFPLDPRGRGTKSRVSVTSVHNSPSIDKERDETCEKKDRKGRSVCIGSEWKVFAFYMGRRYVTFRQNFSNYDYRIKRIIKYKLTAIHTIISYFERSISKSDQRILDPKMG